ncbi:MAG: hypothetical protein OXQ94_12230, partial [Gemmatimonadota bacterium]|nr:hypothetical protein [Gemmatimonadota bacterium]
MMITVAAAAAALAGAGQQAAERPEKAPPGGADGPPTTAVYDGSAGQLDVPALRVAGAAIDIDGEIDEAVWADAPVLTGFTQFDPVEGVPATQRTEARVL